MTPSLSGSIKTNRFKDSVYVFTFCSNSLHRVGISPQLLYILLRAHWGLLYCSIFSLCTHDRLSLHDRIGVCGLLMLHSELGIIRATPVERTPLRMGNRERERERERERDMGKAGRVKTAGSRRTLMRDPRRLLFKYQFRPGSRPCGKRCQLCCTACVYFMWLIEELTD